MTISKLHVPRSLFVGFENLFEDLERIHTSARSGDNYPPHNVIKIDDSSFEIELAVAGFKEDDLRVVVKDGILHVYGCAPSDRMDKVEYVHKGISSRKFEKSFRISEFVVIDGACLRDGMLVIQLRVEVPEEKRPREIKIGSAGASNKKTLLNEDIFN